MFIRRALSKISSTMLLINDITHNLCPRNEGSPESCTAPLSPYIQTCPPHILNQAAVVQFNRREDPVAPSISVHVKCIGTVEPTIGLDSKLP